MTTEIPSLDEVKRLRQVMLNRTKSLTKVPSVHNAISLQCAQNAYESAVLARRASFHEVNITV